MYVFVPPSVVSARVLAATTVFLAMLLLGSLALKITGRRVIGGVVAVTGMTTPWLFEISRLVLETFVIVFSLCLFLFCLYNAHKREKWKLSDSFFLAISLALITYSYTPGRLLAPAFAFGLLLFATNRQRLWEILKTWAIYFVTLTPLIVVYLKNGLVITKRITEVTYILPDKPWLTMATEIVSSFLSDISPAFLLVEGDPIKRHHVGGMGEILVATYVLAVFGVILVLLRNRRDPWWHFILFGLIVSVVPGAVTVHRHHALRLLALPIFLLILTVPALNFLIGDASEDRELSETVPHLRRSLISNGLDRLKAGRSPKRIILIFLLLLTIGQAAYFQFKFRELGSRLGHMFDASYPKVLNVALAQPSRPIYLKDGHIGGVAYTHAYWYGAIKGVDPANFVHLPFDATPPFGSVVLSSDLACTNCTMIFRDDNFSLYTSR